MRTNTLDIQSNLISKDEWFLLILKTLQLNDRGKLVIPVGDSFSQMLQVAEKLDDNLEKTDVCGCAFVPLVGKFGWQGSNLDIGHYSY